MRTIVKILSLVLSLSSIVSVQAQNNSSFVKTFGSSQVDNPIGLVQGHDKDILICGNKRPGPNINSAQATIYLLDSLGTLIENRTFNDIQFFNNIIQTQVGYTFLGVHQNQSIPYDSRFVMLKTDYNLNFLDSFHVFLTDTLMPLFVRSIVDSEGQFIANGFYADSNFAKIFPFVYKFNSTGDITHSQIGKYNGFVQGLNRVILEDFGNNGYYLFDQLGGGKSMILHLDSNLNLNSSKSLEMPNNTQDVHDVVKIGSDKIFYVSKGMKTGQFYAVCLDTANTLHCYKEIGHPHLRNYFLDGLSLHNNSLFIASSPVFDITNLYFPQDTNRIKLIKMDTSLNIHWEKEIGWDAYFIRVAVHATKDGGCLVSASVYDKDTMNQRHDIVLFKLDANGNVTGTHRIENAAPSALNAYPNPGRDHFYVEGVNGSALNVYSQSGKKLFEQELHTGRSKVEMGKYPSGVYILRLVDKEGRPLASGKWIKR